MQAEPNSNHRIWSHTFAAAIVLLLFPIVIAAVGWFTGHARDSDMTGVHELIFLLIGVLTLPAFLLAFGVLAPAAIALDRLVRGRTSRLTNMLLGMALAVPTFVAFFLGAALIRSGLNAGSFAANVIRSLSILEEHPERALIAIGLFSLPGMTVALGMRHRGAGSVS